MHFIIFWLQKNIRRNKKNKYFFKGQQQENHNQYQSNGQVLYPEANKLGRGEGT